MKAQYNFIVSLFLMITVVSSVSAQEPVYWDVVDKIMEEAFERSEVMQNASWITDVYGPRNSKSSGYIGASKWAKDKLDEYGLSNARLEPFEFAVGGENEYTSIHMMAPQYMPIIGYPAAWSQGTNGKILAQAIHINLDEITVESDLDKYREKIRGKIVFVRPQQKITPHFEPMTKRYTEEELDEMAKIPIGPPITRERRRRPEGLSREQKFDMLFAEGAVAIAKTDPVHYFGSVGADTERWNGIEKPWDVNSPIRPLELVMAVEHYNRILHILEEGIPVEMELEVSTILYQGDPTDYNVIAEIPGTDLANEIVINAAHLQSYPHGTGAIDNAAGVVTAMEAMRILKEIGVKPRRTIRLGLWGGHDGSGDSGQTMHVYKHFADPRTKEYKKDYDNHVITFTQDLGPSAMRGINAGGNEVLRSIFKEWIKPLHSIGFEHIYTGRDQGAGLKGVGLLGLKFDQDAYDMLDWIAHINMDTYERLFPEGMMQSSVVVATFLYHAAMRDEKLPRLSPRPW